MTVTAPTARHLLLRLAEARLPDAILGALRDEVVLTGYLRASGVLADVQIRAYDGRLRGHGPPRKIAGPIQAISLEGSIGLANGDVTCGLRAVLSRETESGLETIAGEIVEARVVAAEVMITALDDVTATRALDASGVWLLDPSGGGNAVRPAAAPAPAPAPAATWAEATKAAAAPDPEPPKPAPPPPPATSAPKPSPTYSASAMPMRPVKPQTVDDNTTYPEQGDAVEHFASGRCEVVKSDGDRLHIRLGKDGRIKEISTDMLKITELEPEPGSTTKRFKLDRKL